MIQSPQNRTRETFLSPAPVASHFSPPSQGGVCRFAHAFDLRAAASSMNRFRKVGTPVSRISSMRVSIFDFN